MCYSTYPTENIWMDMKRTVHSMREKFRFAKIGERIYVARYAKTIRDIFTQTRVFECENLYVVFKK